MRKYAALITSSVGLVVFTAALAGQTRAPRTHRLEATPDAVGVRLLLV